MHLKISLADFSPVEEQGVKRTGMRVVLLLVFWLTATCLTSAQSSEDGPPLNLSKEVTVDIAVAGDTLTYLLVLTNTWQIPLEEVVVSDTTPAGTTLFGVNSPPGWMMTTPGQGRTGQVIWQAEEPLPPDAEVTLEFIVTINPDTTGPIINDIYSAQTQRWSEPITGPPVITELVSPTPTWTPPPVPTEISTKTPTGAPTKILPTTSATTPAATTTTSPDVVLEQAQSPTPVPSPTLNTSPENTSGSLGVGIIALVALGIVVTAIGLIFLIGRKTRG